MVAIHKSQNVLLSFHFCFTRHCFLLGQPKHPTKSLDVLCSVQCTRNQQSETEIYHRRKRPRKPSRSTVLVRGFRSKHAGGFTILQDQHFTWFNHQAFLCGGSVLVMKYFFEILFPPQNIFTRTILLHKKFAFRALVAVIANLARQFQNLADIFSSTQKVESLQT